MYINGDFLLEYFFHRNVMYDLTVPFIYSFIIYLDLCLDFYEEMPALWM